jgi:curli biogenesis system outer membrane secretion channel CsgG
MQFTSTFPQALRVRVTGVAASLAVCAALLTVFSGGASAQTAARVDDSQSSKQLAKVRRTAAPKTAVAIYEFRSVVPEVRVGAAQEMFVTALIKSGAFAVAERQRLNEGVMRERQLNASGVTSGNVATGQIAGARYIFEVVVSEANVGGKSSGSNMNLGGMTVSGGSTQDSIGMDVRIVDAQSGLVVDAVNVTKAIESSTSSVSGVGNLLQSLGALKGKSLPISVDGDTHSSRKEGVDRALRSCIEVAVAELARRLTED